MQSSSPKIKLRPCPFCGSRPSLRKGSRYTKDSPLNYQRQAGIVAGAWRWMPGIRCVKCKIDCEFESQEAAADWWNGNQYSDPAVRTEPGEVLTGIVHCGYCGTVSCSRIAA